VIDAATFEIPAGQTRRVVGDLRINTTGDLRIAGTLQIPPGVNVVLNAGGDYEQTGNLEASSAGATVAKLAVPPTVDTRGVSPYSTRVSGVNVRCAGRTDLPPGSNFVACTAGNQAGNITISGAVTLPAGADGTAPSDLRRGKGGGAILIGSANAVELIKEVNPKAIAPNTVTISANLRAGDGGNGYSDVGGAVSGLDRAAEPGRGGHGGDVTVGSGNVLTIVGAVDFQPGKGGGGGFVGRERTGGDGFLVAGDGSVRGRRGGSVTVNPGSGGDAGVVSVSAPVSNGSATIKKARGGACSSIFVRSGTGGPAGDGGWVTIYLTRNGKNSDGQAENIASQVVVQGGHGGRGDADSQGGGGGNLAIEESEPAGRSVTIEDAFRGGDGFDGCAQQPRVQGTFGGRGGTMDYGGVPLILGRTPNGGDGGPSINIITNGGVRGKLNGAAAGRDGEKGIGCDYYSRVITIIRDYTVDGKVKFQKDQRVPVSRFRGFRVAGPEENCEQVHMHGPATIDGYGPFPDPNPEGCGWGALE